MTHFNIHYFEIKLFNYLKNNNFVNNFNHIKYLNEFFEIYKRIEIQRLIINYKLYKLKKDIYFNCYKYEMLINNKYLFNLIKLKKYYLNKLYFNKHFYFNLLFL